MKTKGTPGHDRLSAMRHPLLAAAALFLVACAPRGDALYARAEKSLATGEVRAAIIDLKNLVKDEPQNAKARALLASALAQNGEMAAAAIEVQKAKDLGAAAETLVVPECRLMIARAEFETVLEACKPESATGAAKVDLQIVQGRALLGLERAAEAKPQFAAAHAADAGNLEALLGLASATYALEGLPAAQAVMAKASPDIQAQSAYWMAMGGIHAQGGDLAAAEADYQKALAKVGKGAEGRERLTALGAIAETQMRQGKVDDAVKTTDQMIELAPDNPLVKQLRAQVAAAGGKLDEARTLLEEAVAAMPDNTQARTALGVVNLQLGNLGQAEMHFQNVLASEPGNVRAQKLLAETRARLGSPAESLESLKPTLADANADPSLLAMAGRMSLAAGNREQALAYFSQASTKSPGSQPAEVQLEVAGGYLAAGDFDKALELLDKMPEDGKGLQREVLLMVALLRKGDTAKALSEAKALVDRQPADPQARNLAAGVYAAAGQKDEARRQFNEALKLKPNDPSTLINLGRLDLADGKAAEAGKSFQKALDADPKNLIATVGLATAAAMTGDNAGAEKWLKQARADHPDSIEAVLVLSQFYMGTRAFDKAKSVIDEAAQKSPDNAALSNQRGLAMMGLNDVPGAIASFKQATTQAPKGYAYAMNLARAHLANRDLDSALEVLNGVLKSEPKHGPSLALAAAASLQAGEIEKATGYVERLRQVSPGSPATFVLEGDLAMAQKRYKDALASYRKASAQGSNTTLVLAQYRAASLSGEANADKVLEDWVAANPGDVGVVAALAESRHAKGDRDGAITLYEAALARAPDNVVLLNNLAMLYDAKGNPKAVEYAERAYKAAPQAPAIADTYGWILFKQGKTDQAYDLIREAANKMPDSAEVQYHLAAVLAKKGDKEQAVKLLRKASGSLPANVKPEAQKLLEQLTK